MRKFKDFPGQPPQPPHTLSGPNLQRMAGSQKIFRVHIPLKYGVLGAQGGKSAPGGALGVSVGVHYLYLWYLGVHGFPS